MDGQMPNQRGFTLVELMVVIAIIAALTAIGLPGYQRYLQRAALTDMLQLTAVYRLAVELCDMQQGSLDSCHSGQHGIPASRHSRYVSAVQVRQGSISMSGRRQLAGLTLVLTPARQSEGLNWMRRCEGGAAAAQLVAACETLFQVDTDQTLPHSG